jgi:hypothetical protein
MVGITAYLELELLHIRPNELPGNVVVGVTLFQNPFNMGNPLIRVQIWNAEPLVFDGTIHQAARLVRSES